MTTTTVDGVTYRVVRHDDVTVPTPRRRHGIIVGHATSHRTLWHVSEADNAHWIGCYHETRREALAWIAAQS